MGSNGGANVPARGHLRHVEGMRAAAALVVFVNHAYAQVWNPMRDQYPRGVLSAFSYFLVYGHLSVTVFIVISGFCLALPVLAAGDQIRGGAKDFFRRRARRILPPYYGALALCLVLIGTILGEPTGTIWDVPILVSRASIVSHALLLQDLYGTGSINYVFWSIAVEWQIYFLFPLLVWSWRRYGPTATVSVALVGGYALLFAFGATRIARANPHFLGMFALGMAAAYVAKCPREPYLRWRHEFPWRSVALASAAIAGGLILIWGIATSTTRFHWLDLPVGAMTACILVTASTRTDGIAARVFAWKPLAIVGTFSYSVYLIHAPALQLLWLYVIGAADIAPGAKFAFLMTLGLALVLGAAYLFFRVLEEPFMRPAKPRPVPVPVPNA